jgi:hypothetical protein
LKIVVFGESIILDFDYFRDYYFKKDSNMGSICSTESMVTEVYDIKPRPERVPSMRTKPSESVKVAPLTRSLSDIRIDIEARRNREGQQLQEEIRRASCTMCTRSFVITMKGVAITKILTTKERQLVRKGSEEFGQS